MSGKRKSIIEYRPYDMEQDFFLQTHGGLRWHISTVPSSRLHLHNCFEIGICLSGSGKIRFGDEELSFTSGDTLFVGRNIAHTTWSENGEESVWKYIHADTETLFGIGVPPGFHQMFSDCRLLLNSTSHPWAGTFINSITTEMEEKLPEYYTCVRGLCETLFVRLLRVYSCESGKHAQSGLMVSICPALEYMDAHYMESFPQGVLAEQCYMSQTNFRRKFHELMGTNPLSYLHNVRIMKSCALLRSSNLNIYDIAERIGYTSLSCYNRHFMEIMKCTPTAWRNNGGGAHNSTVVSMYGWERPETDEEIKKHNSEDDIQI